MMSEVRVVLGRFDWHPHAHLHDGRVRRTVEPVDMRQDIFRTVFAARSARCEGGRGVSPKVPRANVV